MHLVHLLNNTQVSMIQFNEFVFNLKDAQMKLQIVDRIQQ